MRQIFKQTLLLLFCVFSVEAQVCDDQINNALLECNDFWTEQVEIANADRDFYRARGDDLFDSYYADVLFFESAWHETLDELSECKAQLPPPPPPPPLPGERPQCDVETDFKDGIRTGALWKPISENTGNPVLLYPKELTGELNHDSCEVFDNLNTHILNCPYRGTANGGREHYDVARRASALADSSPLLVRIQYLDGRFDCRPVPDPRVRID